MPAATNPWKWQRDFQKHCPDVRVTLAQNNADYTVVLNHIEVGSSVATRWKLPTKTATFLTLETKVESRVVLEEPALLLSQIGELTKHFHRLAGLA